MVEEVRVGVSIGTIITVFLPPLLRTRGQAVEEREGADTRGDDTAIRKHGLGCGLMSSSRVGPGDGASSWRPAHNRHAEWLIDSWPLGVVTGKKVYRW